VWTSDYKNQEYILASERDINFYNPILIQTFIYSIVSVFIAGIFILYLKKDLNSINNMNYLYERENS